MTNAILLIFCPDQKKITAAVSNFISENNGNIHHADQHIDDQTNTFFMRIEWSLEGFAIERDKIHDRFLTVARAFHMTWDLYFTDQTVRAAIFVSKHLHCLYDLLLRHQAGQFQCEIPLIISNHTNAEEGAKTFGEDFVHLPVTPNNKAEQENKQLALLKEHQIDLVILARYHQILSGDFVQQFPNRIINIHHSFLPAFVGKDPYTQAYTKGVKIIGATSHYVTEDLDQGPIIDQDTVRISHRDVLSDLKQKGEDLEKVVLARAVRWHLQRKILSYENKTVIFD